MPDGRPERRIRIRRGLDLPIGGAPVQGIEAAPPARTVALLGDDYPDVRCSLAVEPGERVRLGQTLFTDRRRPELCFASPGSGIVAAVERGEMRRVVAVVVELDGDDAVSFPAFDAQALAELDRPAVKARLLEAGDWLALRTRPFGRIADPGTVPGAIFVRAMDTNPLAADASVVLRERGDDLRFGLTALSRLCDGSVFVCSRPGVGLSVPAHERVHLVTFEGPHPAGLVGTHIHHLFPVVDTRPVWYAGYQDVLAIGHLFRTGRVDTERVISLAGPRVRRARLLRTRLGASTEDLVRDELEAGDCRILSGSVLSGRRAAMPGSFLGRYHEQICALPARDESQASAWLVPGRLGTRRAPPWRRGPSWGGGLHGRARAMLPLDCFERVVPLRMPLGMLLRSLAAGDPEAARAFGALELEEEDLALCSVLCPSKLDYGSLLREMLRELEGQL